MATCVQCKQGELKPGTAEAAVRVGKHTFRAPVPVRRCAKCSETYWNGPALAKLEEKAAIELARSGEASADAFRLQRRLLGIKAKDLARLLDLTPEQISKYENGKAPIDRRAAALVATMVLERAKGRSDTLERLKAFSQPHLLARSVRLKVAS